MAEPFLARLRRYTPVTLPLPRYRTPLEWAQKHMRNAPLAPTLSMWHSASTTRWNRPSTIAPSTRILDTSFGPVQFHFCAFPWCHNDCVTPHLGGPIAPPS